MTVGAAEIAKFDIHREIGLPETFPESHDLFDRSKQPEIPFNKLINRDDFVTRVVLNESEEKYDRQFVRYLFGVLATIDNQINQNRRLITSVEQKPDKGYRALARCYEREDVIEQGKYYLDGLEETIGWLPKRIKSVVGLPMMGALSIRRQLEKRVNFNGLLFDLPIVGSSGTKTGEADVKGTISPELLDVESLGIFADDVMDTGVSLARWALARQENFVNQGGVAINEAALLDPKAFLDRVNKAKNGDLNPIETDKLWREVADLVWGVNIIVAPIYFKNTSLRDAIDHKVNAGLNSNDRMEHQKARAQMNLLDHSKSIEKKYWIIGGVGEWQVPLLDMKIKGDSLLLKLKKSPYRKQLESWGLGKLDLRVFSGLKDLLAYNPDGMRAKDAVNRLYNFLAYYIEQYAASR